MGRVTGPEVVAAAPPSSTLKHFTHPHDLHPLSLYSPQSLCSGCKLQSSGTMYTCAPCNFTLHRSCAKLPQLITHPSHGGCNLTLLATAAYPGGRFSCNACARSSADSWHYHCGSCDYDLHVTCASKPLKIKHRAHTTCGDDLGLTFKNPYMDVDGFSCDVCGVIGKQQWLYRCNSCEFDLHMDCAAAATPRPPPQLLQQRSAPPLLQQRSALPLHHHAQLAHSASGGGMISHHGQFAAAQSPPQVNGFMGPPQPQVNGFMGPPQPQINGFAGQPQPHLVHSASAGAIGNPYAGNLYRPHGGAAGYPPAAAAVNGGKANNGAGKAGSLGASIMATALQGIVVSAIQGVGQAIVQDAFGGGGGGE